MKKCIALMLAALMMLALAACGQNNTDTNSNTGSNTAETQEAVDGGWREAISPAVTETVQGYFAKLNETANGVTYTPVAFIASQIVAGDNHLVLCKVTPDAADQKATYALVTIYVDLEDNVELTEVQNSAFEAPVEGVSGGWSEPESPSVTKEARAALSAANEAETDANYNPVALLGTQVVAGTNYAILCKVTPADSAKASYYAIAVIYEDLDGNAEITDAYTFTSDTK